MFPNSLALGQEYTQTIAYLAQLSPLWHEKPGVWFEALKEKIEKKMAAYKTYQNGDL